MLPVIEKYRAPMVEANGAARELFTKGYRHVFAVLSTSEQYLAPAIALAAKHAEKLGKKPSQIKFALAMGDEPSPRRFAPVCWMTSNGTAWESSLTTSCRWS